MKKIAKDFLESGKLERLRETPYDCCKAHWRFVAMNFKGLCQHATAMPTGMG